MNSMSRKHRFFSVLTVIVLLLSKQNIFSRNGWEIVNPATPTAAFNDVFWNGEKLFAVGELGTIVSSSDGIAWTRVNSGTAWPLNAVTGNGSLLVAVGDTGMILTSVDGETWVRRNGYRTNMLNDIVWTGSMFVIAGDISCVLTSQDGETWTAPAFPATGSNLVSVAWNGSRIAIVNNGNRMYTSQDGSDWLMRKLPDVSGLQCLMSADHAFIVGGGTEVSSGIPYTKTQLSTSIDDSTWTDRSEGLHGTVCDICRTGSGYVAVGWNREHLAEPTSLILTSPDGSSWTLQNDIGKMHLFGVTATDDFLVAVGENGCIARSTDGGVTWTQPTTATCRDLYGVTWGNNIFVATGEKGTILTSSDGRTWNPAVSGTSNCLHTVIRGNEQFVAVGDSGTILISREGNTWVPSRLESDRYLTGIAWGGKDGEEKFVVCGAAKYPSDGFFPMFSSTDGVVWDSGLVKNDGSRPEAITAGEEMFVTVGQYIYCSSSDGVLWKTEYSKSHCSDVCFNGKEYYSVINFADSVIQRSTDGLIWSTVTETGQYRFNGITPGPDGLVCTGYYPIDVFTRRAGCATSHNGVEWQFETIPAVPEMNAATWGNGKYIAVGLQGTILLYDSSDMNVQPHETSLRIVKENSFSATGTLCSYFLTGSSFIRLTMFDIKGRNVAILFHGTQSAGMHKAWYPKGIRQGRYIVVLENGGRQYKKGIVILH